MSSLKECESYCSPVPMPCRLYGLRLAFLLHCMPRYLLPLLVVAACGGHAGSIFHIVFHLFPVVPSAVYTLLVPISLQRLPNDLLPGEVCVRMNTESLYTVCMECKGGLLLGVVNL